MDQQITSEPPKASRESASLSDQLAKQKKINEELRVTLAKCLEERDTLERMNKETNAVLSETVTAYAAVINSTTWKATKPFRAVMDGIKRLNAVHYLGRTAQTLKNDGVGATVDLVKKKIKRNTIADTFVLTKAQREQETADGKRLFDEKPLVFSVLVPLYNTPKEFLTAMIRSVTNQTYPGWELCLADGSDDDHGFVGETVRKLAAKEPRIRYQKLEKNGGIAENTNACLAMAQGDYIALFDHDDLLHPSALFKMREAIDREQADFLYSDEATFNTGVDAPGNITCFNFKPDFAPDMLRSVNYICHLTVFSRALSEKTGIFNSVMDGAQDYDMILRLTEQAQKIVHVPEILYYWRAHKASTAGGAEAKPYVLAAGKRAVQAHLDRCGLAGDVIDAKDPTTYRVKYAVKNKKISILIPNMDHVETLDKCLRSVIDKSTYRNYEILIIENNSVQTETFAYYDEICAQYDFIRVIRWDGPFNYSAINNFAVKEASGDVLLLLNNDVEVISASWLEEMLMFAQRPDVGAVGAMLYYPDNTVQHAGVILGIGGVAGHAHKYLKRGKSGYMGRACIAQNFSAVTAAVLMIRKEVYEEVGGLDESYAVAFNDVDFCMKVRRAGYYNVFTPYAELYHYESKSRGFDTTPEKQQRFLGEIARFKAHWYKELEAGDPFYNKHLTLNREDFSLKADNE